MCSFLQDFHVLSLFLLLSSSFILLLLPDYFPAIIFSIFIFLLSSPSQYFFALRFRLLSLSAIIEISSSFFLRLFFSLLRDFCHAAVLFHFSATFRLIPSAVFHISLSFPLLFLHTTVTPEGSAGSFFFRQPSFFLLHHFFTPAPPLLHFITSAAVASLFLFQFLSAALFAPVLFLRFSLFRDFAFLFRSSAFSEIDPHFGFLLSIRSSCLPFSFHFLHFLFSFLLHFHSCHDLRFPSASTTSFPLDFAFFAVSAFIFVILSEISSPQQLYHLPFTPSFDRLRSSLLPRKQRIAFTSLLPSLCQLTTSRLPLIAALFVYRQPAIEIFPCRSSIHFVSSFSPPFPFFLPRLVLLPSSHFPRHAFSIISLQPFQPFLLSFFFHAFRLSFSFFITQRSTILSSHRAAF